MVKRVHLWVTTMSPGVIFTGRTQMWKAIKLSGTVTGTSHCSQSSVTWIIRRSGLILQNSWEFWAINLAVKFVTFELHRYSKTGPITSILCRIAEARQAWNPSHCRLSDIRVCIELWSGCGFVVYVQLVLHASYMWYARASIMCTVEAGGIPTKPTTACTSSKLFSRTMEFGCSIHTKYFTEQSVLNNGG